MSRLDEAVRSVPADPSSADDETLDNDLDLNLDAGAAGDADNDEDEQDEKKERSVENVRGELLRKMQKSNQEMMAELRAMRDDIAAAPAVVAPVDNAQPQTLDQMTVEQLEAMKPNVPDEQKVAFGEYLFERKVDAKVDAKLDKFQNTSVRKDQEDKFNETAFERWPELRNKSSEFYGIADRVLSEMGTAGEKNPRAVLEAANEAGLQLGLSPATGQRRTRREPGNVAPGRSTRGTSTPDAGQSEEDAKIASRLGNAMPGRKFTPEQLKRIAKRTKMYNDGINSHVRG